MKKETRDVLLVSMLLGTNEYGFDYIDDDKVNECLMNMYFYMLSCEGNDQNRQNELFEEFDRCYKELNEEQQELVKNDYLSIIESQNKNTEKEKNKTKKKNKK